MVAPSFRLAHLLPVDIAAQLPRAFVDLSVTGVAMDSRRVQPGNVFVALKGQTEDGARYISSAVARGAVAGLIEGDVVADVLSDIPCVTMPKLRAIVGDMADCCSGMPSAALSLVGVTGTNGKTTVTWLLAQLLEGVGLPCGVLGTLGSGLVGQIEAGQLTTADVVTNHQTLARMVDAGARVAAMEVSSHALAQQRVAGLRFAVAVFTNLTRDHLDYHGSMEAYAEAKQTLLAWPGLVARVINLDDEHGSRWAQRAGARLIGYSIDAMRDSDRNQDRTAADVLFVKSDDAFGAVVGHMLTPAGRLQVNTKLIGRFNASNLAAVVATALALGVQLPDIERVLPTLTPAPGRMQQFGSSDDVLAVVDYAHTPDGLEKALTALRLLTRGRLWCVFGCGGDRDRGKRPLMAAVADRLADCVVLTDDNPRTEDPEQIFVDVRSFADDQALSDKRTGSAHRTEWRAEHDRARAIAQAVSCASVGDVVLIAGKGHETYQEIGGVRRDFSDAAVVQAALTERAA